MEDLWAFHMRRLRPGAPPAHLADRIAFSQRPPLRVAQCDACGLVYRNPRERAFELRDIYTDDALEPSVYESLFENQRVSYRIQAARLTRALGRPGRALEVGSYVGAFLTAAGEQGWTCLGLDINEHATRFAKSRGLSVKIGALDADLRDRLSPDSEDTTAPVDAVAIWNCFEQLADPRIVAREARRRIVDGGLFAVRVPNGGTYARLAGVRQGLRGRMARAFLAQNNLLGFPYRHGFTVGSLSLLLERTGFEVVRVYGDSLVPIADQWTRRWAALEERVVKDLTRAVTMTSPRANEMAPWIEVYARAI